MSSDERVGLEGDSDLKAQVQRSVYRRFARIALGILLSFGFFFGLWWTWDEIFQGSLPKADSMRFSVAVAHLENDKDRRHERRIVEALKELEGVQILSFDRTITFQGAQSEEGVRGHHETARKYLKTSGADALVWGIVPTGADKTYLKLYWTPSGDLKLERLWERYGPTDDLNLPGMSWSDLADVLRLLVVTHHAEFQAREDHFIADHLTPFMEKVRRLVDGSRGQQGPNTKVRPHLRMILANSLLSLGQQSGETKSIQKAVVAYREVVEEWTRERDPSNWAMAQDGLAHALVRLGERESGTERLEQAAVAYRDVLKERTRERVPLDWAVAQNGLAYALVRLGERESGTERLEQAVAAYREVLKEWTRERDPSNWAMAQNGLAHALVRLGERESGTGHLEQAVAAYREALKEWTSERRPLQWAATNNDLGNALRALGERKKDLQLTCEALASHVKAWEVFYDGEPSYASTVAKNVELDIANLKKDFKPEEFKDCVERAKGILE